MRSIYILLMLSFAACKQQDTLKAGNIIDSVVCRKAPAISYALYIPVKNNGATIYFFDPHGAGSLPLRKYKSLADQYGFILVGSNDSKNGQYPAAIDTIWEAMSADTRERIKMDVNRVYVCGFSGGARAAGHICMKYPNIKSLIASGQTFADAPSRAFPFTIYQLAGEGDLNLTPMLAFSNSMDNAGINHHLIHYDGKHEWAPVATMEQVFAGLNIEAHHIPSDFISHAKIKLDKELTDKQMVKAEQDCRLMLSYFNSDPWFTAKLQSIMQDPLYIKENQERQAILAREQYTMQEYQNNFSTRDTAYWPKIIRDLNTGAQQASAEGAMDQRLLAYLSLAFYSVTNQFVAQGYNDVARHFVELYQLADPGNGEAYFLSAVLYARDNNRAAAESEVKKAISNGFTDQRRLSDIQQNILDIKN